MKILLYTCSQDRTVRIWDVVTFRTHLIISGHSAHISFVKWGGTDLLYTASHDRTIKVWRASDVSRHEFEIGHV